MEKNQNKIYTLSIKRPRNNKIRKFGSIAL